MKIVKNAASGLADFFEGISQLFKLGENEILEIEIPRKQFQIS